MSVRKHEEKCLPHVETGWQDRDRIKIRESGTEVVYGNEIHSGTAKGNRTA